MDDFFLDPIMNLLEADIPIKGIKPYLSQGKKHQIICMSFSEDVDLPEHSHETQWGIVLEGEIDLIIDVVKNKYKKRNRCFIPKNIVHSGKIHAGYSDITFFNE